jgi:hypothetical protein
MQASLALYIKKLRLAIENQQIQYRNPQYLSWRNHGGSLTDISTSSSSRAELRGAGPRATSGEGAGPRGSWGEASACMIVLDISCSVDGGGGNSDEALGLSITLSAHSVFETNGTPAATEVLLLVDGTAADAGAPMLLLDP